MKITPEKFRERSWHAVAPDDVLSALEVSREGLSSDEVESRREMFGETRLPEESGAMPPCTFRTSATCFGCLQ